MTTHKHLVITELSREGAIELRNDLLHGSVTKCDGARGV